MRKTLLVNGREITLEDLTLSEDGITFTLEGKTYALSREEALRGAAVSPPNTKGERHVFAGGAEGFIALPQPRRRGAGGASKAKGSLAAPMPGKVLKVLVKKGDKIKEEQPLIVMEAMKMELTIRASQAGEVASLPFREGDQVTEGAVLVELKT